MKNLYETVIIFRGDLTSKQFNYRVKKYRNYLTDNEMIIEDEDVKGKKALAYEIKMCKFGWYVLYTYKCEPDKIAPLDNKMRIDDDIIKFLTIKRDDECEEEKIELAKRDKVKDALINIYDVPVDTDKDVLDTIIDVIMSSGLDVYSPYDRANVYATIHPYLVHKSEQKLKPESEIDYFDLIYGI